MAKWHSGREAKYLDAILDGTKLYEGRLNKGKFAEYRVGDEIGLRRDIRNADGTLTNGHGTETVVKITRILQFANFEDMMNVLDYSQIIPDARDKMEAVKRYEIFYSKAEQDRYGVLAIGITPISH